MRNHDGSSDHLLRTVPGIGNILALTIVYEIHTIEHFPRVGDFLSYSLVKGCDTCQASFTEPDEWLVPHHRVLGE